MRLGLILMPAQPRPSGTSGAIQSLNASLLWGQKVQMLCPASHKKVKDYTQPDTAVRKKKQIAKLIYQPPT